LVSAGLALLLSTVAAFADVVGGAITVVRRATDQQILWFTALGAGFLFGATFLDRLPDALAELPDAAPLLIAIGYLGMLLLHRFGSAHTHAPTHHASHLGESGCEAVLASFEAARVTAAGAGRAMTVSLERRSAVVTFLGLLVHTFMDGLIIAGTFSLSVGAGILMFAAAVLHKIPEGFTMATVSLAAGESRKTAFFTSFGLAVSTLLGALVAVWAGATDVGVVKVMMALATGTFIFISTSSLIPTVTASGHRRTVFAVIAGVILFYLSLLLVHAIGLE
jgi:zinc transporter ZupT